LTFYEKNISAKQPEKNQKTWISQENVHPGRQTGDPCQTGQRQKKTGVVNKRPIEGFFFTQRGEAQKTGRIFNAFETRETDILGLFFSHCL
jgi:hypothetical protein